MKCDPYPAGEAHFNSSQVPLLYFNVLLLSQQFEAVSSQSLYPTSPLPPHSPHSTPSPPHSTPSPLTPLLPPSLHSLSPLQAIEFLSRVEPFHSHAVHFAIALQEMHLLHLTESTRSKLCKCPPNFVTTTRVSSFCVPIAVVKDSGVYRLNFARLVIGYTRRFSQTDPREALQYFFLLKVYIQHSFHADFHVPILHTRGWREGRARMSSLHV